MCGRFTQMFTWSDLVALYRIHEQARRNIRPNYNVAPTQEIDIVRPTEDGDHEIVQARWGLVPIWWKKPLKDLPSTINARAETVAEKPMFRSAYKTRRCVIPASGFYEWTGPKGQKQPWYMSGKDTPILSFAGLWETFHDPEDGEKKLSATIIVGPPNEFVSSIHKRMPVILDPKDIDAWMGEDPQPDLLRPAPEDALQAWKVSPQVNNSRYQGEDAIEPLEA